MNLIQRILSWLSKNPMQKGVGKTMQKVSKTVNAVNPGASKSTASSTRFGTATILSSQQIPQASGDTVQVSAKLSVNDGKGNTWPAQIMTIVPTAGLTKFSNGNVIPVQYDAKDKSKVKVIPG
ncbi:MAG TPA: hypothetical protein VKY37_07235 [Brumimicrobium sp.]|nr:hypothetical protein [Brumimicrobium sp.]